VATAEPAEDDFAAIRQLADQVETSTVKLLRPRHAARRVVPTEKEN
jgi:hypothetical protein